MTRDDLAFILRVISRIDAACWDGNLDPKIVRETLTVSCEERIKKQEAEAARKPNRYSL